MVRFGELLRTGAETQEGLALGEAAGADGDGAARATSSAAVTVSYETRPVPRYLLLTKMPGVELTPAGAVALDT